MSKDATTKKRIPRKHEKMETRKNPEVNKVSFYPGCSLSGTAKEYLNSTKSICENIEIELVEIPDWSCCGASSAHSLSYEDSVLLPARNLAIADDLGLPVVTPCSACYSRLKFAQKEIKENKKQSK